MKKEELQIFLLEEYNKEEDELMNLLEKTRFTTNEVVEIFINVLLKNFKLEKIKREE